MLNGNRIIQINQQYSVEFKIEAIKRIEETGKAVTAVAKELEVKPTTLQGWVTNKW